MNHAHRRAPAPPARPGRHGRPLPGALRRYDPKRRALAALRDRCRARAAASIWPSSSPCWKRAMRSTQLIDEARSVVAGGARARSRIGLLNYLAGAVLMPYAAVPRRGRRSCATTSRHVPRASAVSFEQACQRLSTLQRQGARGVPFFFLRVDPAGNVIKRFSAAGFPFARFGGSCPRWVVHAAFATPGDDCACRWPQLPDGATYLCFARTVDRPAGALGRAAADPRAWRWAATSRMPASWSMRTGSTWSAPRSASGCRAGCATGRIAARGRFRRWRTGCRSIPMRRRRHPTGSRRIEGRKRFFFWKKEAKNF